MLSRRAFLWGGGAATAGLVAGGAGAWVASTGGVASGRTQLARVLTSCDPSFGPGADPGAVRRGRFRSSARGREVQWVLALPPGVDSPAGLPLVLVLHGRGGRAANAVDDLHLDRHLAALGRPLAVAAVDGGDGYWHPRASGDDPLRMLVDELVPLVGADASRLGALGWSMGGYGVLNLARESAAGRLGGLRVGAVAALSPALFASAADARPGAFDGPEDYARWGNLLDDPATGTVAVRVECGGRDPFAGVTRAYLDRASPRPAGGITKGCHDAPYWQRAAPAALAHLAAHL